MIKNLVFDGNGVIYKDYKDEKGNKIRVLKNKGVRKKLKELKKQYILFILTDGKEKINIKKDALKRMRVFKFFKEVLGTYQIKISKKKSPEAFMKALKLWNIKKKETIFIGHDNREIDNAKKAGLKTIKTQTISSIAEL